MTSPKWFLIATGLLVVNAAAVVMTGYWRHAGADEPTRGDGQENVVLSSTVGETQDKQVVTEANQGVNGEANKTADQPKRAKSTSPLDAIPIPASMPEFPSLADPESLKDDPGFQEFRRLFAKEEESWDTEPPLLRSGHSESQSQVYFEALTQRLETVEKLCSAARSIASEAALQARTGGQEKSQELVRMTTQLRDIAAKLLVSEL